MSARRQPSTTSLARYARTTSPDTSARSFDFCNAFWGVGDGGVDVLFARMRGAARTMEELRSFWKERSTIEEDYAKRLAKLAKMPIGKDEIGELRNAIDTLRLETDKQAGCHSQLAQQIRIDLEGQVGAFVTKQQQHKKLHQVAIEREFKNKQTREQHAQRAREKYESDCVRINSYTAQSTLVQGKDLEKVHFKLERAQQAVQVNENDYAQFTKVLQETMTKWEHDWKSFCDLCQDLEEERIEFMKDNMWAYANAVSTVCVSDDESCEKMRLALEQLEPEKDMENFVRDYGTGNAIPEPPTFVNYANTDAPPVSSSRIVTRPSIYIRASQRASRPAAVAQDDEPYDDTNHAGVGARGSGGPSGAPLSRSATQKSTAPPSHANGVNGHVSPSREPRRRHSTASAIAKPAPGGDPIDPTVTNTQLVIGETAYNVDPNKDPQQQRPTQARTSPPVGELDPLVVQMAGLNAAAAANSTTRRNTIRQDGPPPSVESRRGTGDSLSTPPTTNAAPRDFRNPAEAVVGSYPLAQPPSRSASPNPPKAVLAAPPPPSVSPGMSNIPVEQVVNNYRRPFPGEPRSRANSYVGPPPIVNPSQDPGAPRPTSRAGYPGVSAQPLAQTPTSPAKGPSPTTAQPHRGPPAPAAQGVPAVQPNNGPLNRSMSVSHRPVTPNNNPAGIVLGPDGRVMQDNMMVQVQTVHQPPHYVQPGPPPPPPPSSQPPQGYGYHDESRAVTHVPRNEYGVPSGGYNQQVYGHGHGPYGQTYPASTYPQPPPPPPVQPVSVPTSQPPPAHGPQTGYTDYGIVTRAGPYRHGPSQSLGPVGNTAQPYGVGGYPPRRSPSPAPPRGQGPPPTGTYTDDGRPILFYVKALYDYAATIDEEFDFQAGDIIAVTETPEDGWWSGELLDDTRRQPGRHVFPSNFVCLF